MTPPEIIYVRRNSRPITPDAATTEFIPAVLLRGLAAPRPTFGPPPSTWPGPVRRELIPHVRRPWPRIGRLTPAPRHARRTGGRHVA